jgi:hypothetical protein
MGLIQIVNNDHAPIGFLAVVLLDLECDPQVFDGVNTTI